MGGKGDSNFCDTMYEGHSKTAIWYNRGPGREVRNGSKFLCNLIHLNIIKDTGKTLFSLLNIQNEIKYF